MSKKILFVVDAQNDFMEGGALAVPKANEIIPFINERLASGEYDAIYFSKDWHPKNHCSFKENGGIWPPHCIQSSFGACINSDIVIPIEQSKKVKFIYKGLLKDKEEYGAYVPESFNENQSDCSVDVVGLATEFCCFHTAKDLKGAGFKVNFLLDGMRSITDEGKIKVFVELSKIGVDISV